MRLFVYGSLKRGQPHHRELHGARFIGPASTAQAFALREIAGYPALVPGDRAIAGELYDFTAQRLNELDEFEGDAYVRQEIRLADGETVLAYLASAPEAGLPLAGSEWPAR